MTQEKWGQLREQLLKTVGKNNYTTWIEPLEFQDLNDGVATFSVPTNFVGNYVSQNFADLIIYELKNAGASVQRLAFRVLSFVCKGYEAGPRAAGRSCAVCG